MGILNHQRVLQIGWWMIGLAVITDLHAQASREYDLKAAFLYNFATFVDWPPTAFASPDTPFTIGVLGDDPFGPTLDEIVAGERVRDRPFRIVRFDRLEDVTVCHLLFICPSEERHLRQIVAATQGRPILTVADFPNFVLAGGIIGFGTEDNRVRLFINPRAAEASSLVISSKLLQLAVLIEVPSHDSPR